jgi:hypothetical protein
MVQHASVRSPDLDPAALPAALTGSPAGPASSPGESPKLSLITAPAAGQPAPRVLPQPLGPESREYALCDLCGAHLGVHSGHFHMVSPLTARSVSVCRTCRRAALGEGYQPRA